MSDFDEQHRKNKGKAKDAFIASTQPNSKIANKDEPTGPTNKKSPDSIRKAFTQSVNSDVKAQDQAAKDAQSAKLKQKHKASKLIAENEQSRTVPKMEYTPDNKSLRAGSEMEAKAQVDANIRDEVSGRAADRRQAKKLQEQKSRPKEPVKDQFNRAAGNPAKQPLADKQARKTKLEQEIRAQFNKEASKEQER